MQGGEQHPAIPSPFSFLSLQKASQPKGAEQVLSNDTWSYIFSFVANDPRFLIHLLRVSKRFKQILEPTNSIWKLALASIRIEYALTSTRSARSIYYLNEIQPQLTEWQTEYHQVRQYGKTLVNYKRALKAQFRRAQETEDWEKRKRVFRTVRHITAIATPYILYYLFILFLYLKLSNTSKIPSWTPLLPVAGFCAFVVQLSATFAFCNSSKAVKSLNKVVNCEGTILCGTLLLSPCLIILSTMLYLYATTGKYEYVVISFAGVCLLLVLCMLSTFTCSTRSLRKRFGPWFRVFMALSFTAYLAGIGLLVYLHTHPNDPHAIHIERWGRFLICLSYFFTGIYVLLISHCFQHGYFYEGIRCLGRCGLGLLELLAATTIFGTTALIYLNVFKHFHIHAGFIMIPMVLFPLTITVLCNRYAYYQRRAYDFDNDYALLV